ncbi:taurine catabolism dioxygenase [Venturia nashicola]|nr:taurine catabolism dioxygenase [Venturia nashicola]
MGSTWLSIDSTVLMIEEHWAPEEERNTRSSDCTTIQLEECPADYSSLRLLQLPKNGGDTLFASGYDLYDRFSKPYQKLFNSLTASYDGGGFLTKAEDFKLLNKGPRGSPENCRFKWRNQNDIAIWDNRSVFHSATFDYAGLGDRAGNRVVGIGEKPYFDPNSLSKAEALAASVQLSA